MIPIPPSHWVNDLQAMRSLCCSTTSGNGVSTEAPVVVIPDTASKKELVKILAWNIGSKELLINPYRLSDEKIYGRDPNTPAKIHTNEAKRKPSFLV